MAVRKHVADKAEADGRALYGAPKPKRKRKKATTKPADEAPDE